MSVKIIAHPETGKLFTETSKEGWVKCQLQSKQMTVNNGVITMQTRTAFPLIQQEVVNACAGLKSGSVFPLEGKITRKVTSEPQFEGHKKVVNPTTSEEMNYYQTFSFTTNMQEQDVDERVAEEITDPVKEPANPAFDGEI